MRGKAWSTAARPRAKPSTSLRCPQTMSKSTRLVNSKPSSKLRQIARLGKQIDEEGQVLVVGAHLELAGHSLPQEHFADLAQRYTGTPASCSKSRYVGAGGAREKSRRSFVRTKASGEVR